MHVSYLRVDTADVAKKLKQLGPVRVFDVRQAAYSHGMLQEWNHNGTYYLLPPVGRTAAEMQAILDENKAADLIHFTYNAQSSIDMNHKPILPMDSFADENFSNPPHGVVKVTAVSRSKVAELDAILDQFKITFDPSTFPGLDQVNISLFKPPVEGYQTVVTLRLLSEDWKLLTDLEERIKKYLAEGTMLREILVTRHTVKGLEPELTLSSLEGTTEKGHKFLNDLGVYLQGRQLTSVTMNRDPIQTVTPQESRDQLADLSRLTLSAHEKKQEKDREVTPAELQRKAVTEFAVTLKSMAEFASEKVTSSGPTLLVEFPKKGLMGLGGHFSPEQEKALRSVYNVVRLLPGLHEGWAAHYHYDKASRLLSISVKGENERPPSGWSTLK